MLMLKLLKLVFALKNCKVINAFANIMILYIIIIYYSFGIGTFIPTTNLIIYVPDGMNTLQSLLNTCIMYILKMVTYFCDSKLPDSQNDAQQPESSQTVNKMYSDMMLVSGTNRDQNEVVVTTTTNDVRNDDIYVENEEGEYDHLHTSRPKQGVSEREDERYATSTQLEDVTYSTVRKSRKFIPERDNEYMYY